MNTTSNTSLAPQIDDSPSNDSLGMQLVAQMADITRDRIQALALENARNNLGKIREGESLRALRGELAGTGDKAIIIAAGPRLKRKQVAEQIIASDYQGAIIATERSML